MFDNISIKLKQEYEKQIYDLIIFNREMKNLNKEKYLLIDYLHKYFSFKNLFLCIRYFLGKKLRKRKHLNYIKHLSYKANYNYFSKYKIAVYTSLYGKYDNIFEPLTKPNNIDYYIFTDNELNKNTCWQSKNVNFEKGIMSPIEKNRYIKTHPHILFPEYDYSIYLDANIKIVGDFTALTNRIGNLGIAFHFHQNQSNIYDLIDSCIIGNKDDSDLLEKHRKHLLQDNMPPNLGLVEANVIARRHNDPLVISIDEQWWQEFKEYSKRDQISLHHVLWKNKVNVLDIATLGTNVRENDLLYVMKHDKKLQ